MRFLAQWFGITLFSGQLVGAATVVPSDPSLFDTVINLPTDTLPTTFGASTQLNVHPGGEILSTVDNRWLVRPSGTMEINFLGGLVGRTEGTSTYAGEYVTFYEGVTANVFAGTTGRALSIHTGSTVNLDGGWVGDTSTVWRDATLNVYDGRVSGLLSVLSGGTANFFGGYTTQSLSVSGTVNVSGGDIGVRVRTNNGGVLNMSGGTNGGNFTAQAGSTIQLTGLDFFLNGEPIAGMQNGVPFEITDRADDLLLTGTLLDGSPFEFGLSSNPDNIPFGTATYEEDYFDSDASIFLIAIPEPSHVALCGLGGVLLVLLRRR